MSVELIVLRAFMGDQAVAKELLACGFAPDLMPTCEGREAAQTLLDLQARGAAPTLENLRRALDERRGIPPRLRRYLKDLAGTSHCPSLHAVAHLQMLKLDLVMAGVDTVCQRIAAQVAEGGATDTPPNGGPAQATATEPGPTSPSGRCGGTQPPRPKESSA